MRPSSQLRGLMGQRERKSPQCNAAEHGQPSSLELKQDFRGVCGIFNAQIKPQTSNVPISLRGVERPQVLPHFNLRISQMPGAPSLCRLRPALVPPRLRKTTFPTLGQVQSREEGPRCIGFRTHPLPQPNSHIPHPAQNYYYSFLEKLSQRRDGGAHHPPQRK